jgi:EmrB/QacA subfamily drug resistance transporter
LDRKWWVLVAVGVGTLMSALDSSVVNVVLPVMRRELGTDVATIQWVVTGYLLVVSSLLLTFGRLGDLKGNRAMYLTGFAVFVLSSVFCGLSGGESELIAFRVVQALGAAMLFANAPAILTKTFPPTERGRVLGLQGTMTYLGLVIGPPLGGWLTGLFTWRAIFFINVPIGVTALLLGFAFIPADEVGASEERFDPAGAATFALGLALLLLTLNRGHDWGWTSPAVLALALAAAVLLAAFMTTERRVRWPMLDLSLFEARTFSASAAAATLNYVAVFTIIFLVPFYLIQGRGLAPGRAGLLLTVQAAVMAIVAPFSGALSDRIGPRWLATSGMVLLAAGLAGLGVAGRDTPLGLVAAALAVTGLGTGLFVSPNNSALMGAAPRHRQGIAAGVLALARNVGMVLGVGLAGAVFSTVLARGQAAGSADALFAALRTSFMVAAVVALAAGGVSAVAPRRGGAT